MTAPGTDFLSGKRRLAEYNQLSLRNYFNRNRSYYFWKRTFDLSFTLVFSILVLSWLLPLIALMVKCSSPGPIFFVQKRVGFLGRSFYCYKFRTMIVNREANTRQATENDPRITKLGKFLRLCNLDELPQFLNVLRGEMSVIGPRPHMPTDCNGFSDIISQYKFRNIVRPGITGLAQVKGYRGPARDFDSIVRRYQWDAFYVRNMRTHRPYPKENPRVHF